MQQIEQANAQAEATAQREYDLEMAKLDIEKYKIDTEASTKIQVAQMATYNKREDTDLNQNSASIDLEQGQYLQRTLLMADFIARRVEDITGINPQRKGAVDNRETVGGVERAVTQYINQETGFVYILETDVLTAGEGTIQSVGNDGETVLSVGTELYAQQNTGLDDIITISSILTYPEAEETTESYRSDVVDAFRVTPRLS